MAVPNAHVHFEAAFRQVQLTCPYRSKTPINRSTARQKSCINSTGALRPWVSFNRPRTRL